MKVSSGFKKIISLAAAVCFLTTNVTAMPAQESLLGERGSGNVFGSRNTLSLSIPLSLGRVVETYRAGHKNKHDSRSPFPFSRHDPVVVYIQDAHDSLEAQENIAAMIRYFVKEHGVRTVYEEGSEGPVPTDELFSAIPDPALKEKISYFLMDKLRVGGAEYAHINRRSPPDPRPEIREGAGDFKLVGADSISLHLENVRAYEEAAKNRENINRDIQCIRKELQKLIDKNFPKEIKQWLKLKERHERGTMPLVEYLRRSYRTENSGNGKRVTEKPLQGTLPESAAHFSPYPNIKGLLSGKETETKKVGLKPLLEEIKRLEGEIVEAGLVSERDRKTYGHYQNILLLEKLNTLRMSAEEYAALKDSLEDLRTRDVARFIAKESRRSLVLFKAWEDLITDSIRFYELAKKRDASISAVFDEFLASGSGEQNAVLVYGGFHKEAIKKILKEKGLSYVILSPAIRAPSKRHEDYYQRLMNGGRYSFEQRAASTAYDVRRDASPASRAQTVARESACPPRAVTMDYAPVLKHLAGLAAPFISEPREKFIPGMDNALASEEKETNAPRSEARQEDNAKTGVILQETPALVNAWASFKEKQFFRNGWMGLAERVFEAIWIHHFGASTGRMSAAQGTSVTPRKKENTDWDPGSPARSEMRKMEEPREPDWNEPDLLNRASSATQYFSDIGKWAGNFGRLKSSADPSLNSAHLNSNSPHPHLNRALPGTAMSFFDRSPSGNQRGDDGLTVILGYFQIIARAGEEQQGKYLERMEKTLNTMRERINTNAERMRVDFEIYDSLLGQNKGNDPHPISNKDSFLYLLDEAFNPRSIEPGNDYRKFKQGALKTLDAWPLVERAIQDLLKGGTVYLKARPKDVPAKRESLEATKASETKKTFEPPTLAAAPKTDKAPPPAKPEQKKVVNSKPPEKIMTEAHELLASRHPFALKTDKMPPLRKETAPVAAEPKKKGLFSRFFRGVDTPPSRSEVRNALEEIKPAKVAARPLSTPLKNRLETRQIAREAIEELKGNFTILAGLEDVENFTAAQLQEFEVMAVLKSNVKFVFYGAKPAALSSLTPKAVANTIARLKELQHELGADRIVITEGKGEAISLGRDEKVIHISKRDLPRPLLRKNVFEFRYRADETGLVPAALLYADQHFRPFPRSVIDLSMMSESLRAAIQEFQNSIVFARAA